ncbi:MAG: hypothetical protein M3288_03860, partial [Thermoproteota archaeon]|nr:hypothetical protein [Thermoproteota archaeon]
MQADNCFEIRKNNCGTFRPSCQKVVATFFLLRGFSVYSCICSYSVVGGEVNSAVANLAPTLVI